MDEGRLLQNERCNSLNTVTITPQCYWAPYSTQCGACRWTGQAGVPVSALATPFKERRVLEVAKPNHLSGVPAQVGENWPMQTIQ